MTDFATTWRFLTDVPVYMEFLNAVWTLLSACLVFILGRYAYIEWRGNGRSEPFKGSIGFMTYLVGELFVRLAAFVFRYEQNRGGTITNFDDLPFIAWGSILAALGIMCCIRIWSPIRWKAWAWVIPIGLAACAVIYLGWIDPPEPHRWFKVGL